MGERITFEVDQNGGVQVKVNGVKGKRCTDVTKAVQDALGKTVATTPTGEMYEKDQVVHNRR